MHPIIAFCGGQGAGKTTHAQHVKKTFDDYFWCQRQDPSLQGGHETMLLPQCVMLNVKDTFTGFVTPIISELSQITSEFKDQPAFKKLQLAISTWGEEVYKDVWSDRYASLANKVKDLIVCDDIRTDMNQQMLLHLSIHRPVVLFKLVVGEEVRKKRVSFWRENGGYTESELFNPPNYPACADFQWHEVDTTDSFERSTKTVVEKLERFLP